MASRGSRMGGRLTFAAGAAFALGLAALTGLRADDESATLTQPEAGSAPAGDDGQQAVVDAFLASEPATALRAEIGRLEDQIGRIRRIARDPDDPALKKLHRDLRAKQERWQALWVEMYPALVRAARPGVPTFRGMFINPAPTPMPGGQGLPRLERRPAEAPEPDDEPARRDRDREREPGERDRTAELGRRIRELSREVQTLEAQLKLKRAMLQMAEAELALAHLELDAAPRGRGDAERAGGAAPDPDDLGPAAPTPPGRRVLRNFRVDPAPKDGPLRQALDREVPMPFPDPTALEDIIKYLRKETRSDDLPEGIPFYVDPEGLQEARASMLSKVKISAPDLPVKEALETVLRQVGLDFRVQNGLVRIVAAEGARRGD